VRVICFTQREMEAFADASGDLNPLHRDDQVAATGRFEAPVVYGVLGVLAALEALSVRSGLVLHALDASFHRPLFVDSRYQLEVHEEDDFHVTVSIFDSSLRAFTVKATFAEGSSSSASVGEEPVRLREPLESSIEELESGLLTTGHYGASRASTRWLEERFRLLSCGVDGYALHGLLCASYLIGMRLPGRGSLISRLRLVLTPAGHEEAESTPQPAEPLTYRASVVELEAHLREATVSGVLEHGGRRVAVLVCQTRLPSGPRTNDYRRVERHLGASCRLEGRVAVVVGASRGLGAALTHGMASQGCDVYACSRRSGEGSERCASHWAGSIEHVLGDGSDPEFCRDLLECIVERRGGVDFLLCCAAPQLEAIGFGAHSMPRFNDFLRRSVELVTVPMATFLEAVEARSGGCLLVSSTALTTLPPEWGHYVAAKAAGEALAVWSAKCFPNIEMVVARVPRLGRAQGTSQASEEIVEPEQAGARLVNRLAGRVGAGVHLVEW
jgi:hypothetical protein